MSLNSGHKWTFSQVAFLAENAGGGVVGGAPFIIKWWMGVNSRVTRTQPQSPKIWSLHQIFWRASQIFGGWSQIFGGASQIFGGWHKRMLGDWTFSGCSGAVSYADGVAELCSKKIFFAEYHQISMSINFWLNITCSLRQRQRQRPNMWYIFEKQALSGYKTWYWKGVLRQSQKLRKSAASAHQQHQQHQRISNISASSESTESAK